MAKVTVETKLPLTNGKEADLTLENGEVRFKFPVSWDRPTATLADLRAALDELEAIAAPGILTSATEITVSGSDKVEPDDIRRAGEAVARRRPQRTQRINGLDEILESAVTGEAPIVVLVDNELPADGIMARSPVPPYMGVDRALLAKHPGAVAILAGSVELEQVIRDEAKAAGVNVIA